MQEVPYKIYSASAGSGKTYVLSKEYIKTVLSSTHSFKQILAITFTNKAVNEMKHRIITSLFEFSKTTSTADASSMFLDIMKELHLDAVTLQKKSKRTLKEILHNYAFFDISTIDKFTHRLIRTFAKDLKLPQNFEVVLDTNLLLDEAVSALINKAGSNDKLTQVLLDFALEKIDDDKSWDIAIDLTKIGKLLFNENHVPHLKQISDKGLDAFLDLKKKLKKDINTIEQNANNLASETLELISKSGFEYTDFPRETLPNHFKKIIEGIYEPSKIYNNKLEQNLIDNKIVKATVSLSTEELSSQLLQYYSTIKNLLYTRAFLKNAYQNLVPLTVLNAIQHEVKHIQKEKDQLSISEFNTIISNEIKNQPAPFIYERLGEKYRHYFIDEFQDTSEMQWNNLTPLIGNALESENLLGETGSLFLVGDVKQSIYRWRGGKAEQFLDLTNKNVNPFVLPPSINNLPDNYRSYEEVINFNNEFFTSTSSLLSNDTYKNLYIQGNNQGTNTKKGGVVSLSFLEKDTSTDEDYCIEVLQTIKQVKSKDYSYKDICIITRKRKHGVAVANFLMQNNIPIISSESLLLKNSPKVKFLICLLRYNLLPNDLENNYQILNYLSKDKTEKHQFISDNIKQLDTLLHTNYYYDRKLTEQLSVFDTLEIAIKLFALAESSNAYITYFLDIALEIEQNSGADIQTFLNYWDKKEETLSISAPDSMNAVQIMTVHKAKGLEFKIVIFPFANSSFKEQIEPKLWMPINSEISPNFNELLISKKQEVVQYGPAAEFLYNEEEYKLELDAFNVIYVALTRAVKGLYIITKKDLTQKGDHKEATYSGMFIAFLKYKNLWNIEQSIYTFGLLESNPEKTISNKNQTDIAYGYTEKNRPGFQIITKSGMLWNTDREQAINKGNILHNILSNIYTEKDTDYALSKALSSGEISPIDVPILKDNINDIINHPDLCMYYKDTITIYNEKDIITPNGEILRPDRIVIINNKASIIDYKTGKKDSRYNQQLYSYADALESMGYSIYTKIIVYINDKITCEFI
ncbi:UvrD-helicase domain-containing protein [uncultured Maribacter sp.]|uniref:UvrD-helicase domain-containing protein n=1 Tax=uncultured Maribacter sp. TaxID=431308 RepID=UPI00261AC8B2|nr:UvrD-helicase domain-containing protein [uncultured Maribacter sp.]